MLRNNPDLTAKLENLINQNNFSEKEALNLVRQGASPDVRNSEGDYLLSIFIKRKNDIEAKKLIERYNANVTLALHLPASCQKISTPLKWIEAIGAGQYGNVFLANYESNDVAVKDIIFSPEVSYYCNLETFFNEVACLAFLTEANASNVINFIGWTQKGLYYRIVMEYAALGSLKDCISNNNHIISSWESRITIIRGIANGLAAIHKYYVHSDIKSGNVLLVPGSGATITAKITDFGFSAPIHLQEYVGGTPLYQAPESLDGQPNTTKTDMFGLGVTIWETLVLKVIEDAMPLNIDSIEDLLRFLQTPARMRLPVKSASFKMELLVNACWANDQNNRLTSEELKTCLEFSDKEVVEKVKLLNAALLPVVCKYGRMDFVEEALKTGNVNEIYQEGCSSLYLACENGHDEIVKVLIQRGADVYQKDPNNNSLLHTVVQARKINSADKIIKLLLDSGISIFEKNNQYDTALDLAFAANNNAAIHALLCGVKKAVPSTETAVSLPTFLQAKKWVKKNALMNEYDNNFFDHLLISYYLSACFGVLSDCLEMRNRRYHDADIKLVQYYHTILIHPLNTMLDKFICIYNLLCDPLAISFKSRLVNVMCVYELDHAINIFKKYLLSKFDFTTDEQMLAYAESKSRTSFYSNKLACAKNEIELFAAINEIGCFCFQADMTLGADEVIKRVNNYLNNNGNDFEIPVTFGLRDKVIVMKEHYLSAKIGNVRNKNELTKIISEIGFFPTSRGFRLKNKSVETRVGKYFKSESKANMLPRVYGLRDKAVSIRNDDAEPDKSIKKKG